MLTKQKTFSAKPRLQSNAKKLTDWMGGANTDTAIRVEDADEIPAVLLEEDAEEVSLKDIPEVPTTNSRSKRAHADDDDDEHIFVQSEEDEEEDIAPKRRKKTKVTDASTAQEDEDKKKLGMKTSYEGFSIYGRILCLIVKRKGVKKSVGGNTAGTQMLENWVSTQADNEGALDDVEDG
jgi:Zn-dependent metalloprotease